MNVDRYNDISQVSNTHYQIDSGAWVGSNLRYLGLYTFPLPVR